MDSCDAALRLELELDLTLDVASIEVARQESSDGREVGRRLEDVGMDLVEQELSMIALEKGGADQEEVAVDEGSDPGGDAHHGRGRQAEQANAGGNGGADPRRLDERFQEAAPSLGRRLFAEDLEHCVHELAVVFERNPITATCRFDGLEGLGGNGGADLSFLLGLFCGQYAERFLTAERTDFGATRHVWDSYTDLPRRTSLRRGEIAGIDPEAPVCRLVWPAGLKFATGVAVRAQRPRFVFREFRPVRGLVSLEEPPSAKVAHRRVCLPVTTREDRCFILVPRGRTGFGR